MCRFVESIKLKNGVPSRLKYHQQRVNMTFETFFPDDEPLNVFQCLTEILLPSSGLFKLRLVFDSGLISIDFSPYVRRDIMSLKLEETTIESSPFKVEDRAAYNAAFEKRAACDDVLLVKNGFLTDTSYCNIALYDGQKWFTPKIPLLYGTNRAELIANDVIFEKDIPTTELPKYQKICLFNAMIDFEELVLDINAIV